MKYRHFYNSSVFVLFFAFFSILSGCATEDNVKDDVSVYSALASAGIKLRTDGAGDLVFTGFAYGDVEANTGSSEADSFISKYSSAGGKQWYKQAGGDDEDYLQGITVAASGNIYVAGYTSGEVETGAGLGNTDIIVMKYTAAGTLLWTKQYGSTGNDTCWGIDSDSADNLYLVGSTDGVITGSGATNAQGIDLVIIKLDSNGAQQWVRQLGSDVAITTNTYSKSYGVSVAVDASDDVIIGGITNDAIGGDRIGGYDLIVAKYEGNGDQTWIKHLGTTYDDYLKDVGVADNLNIYFTGYSYGTVDPNYTYADYEEDHTYTEIFLYKYNTSGTQQWVKQTGTSTYDRSHALAIDAAENIYLTGNTNGALEGTNAGSYDFFMLKYDANGTIGLKVQNGSDVYDSADGIAVDGGGNVYLTGRTYGTLDSKANADAAFTAFISKYNATGVLQWTQLF